MLKQKDEWSLKAVARPTLWCVCREGESSPPRGWALSNMFARLVAIGRSAVAGSGSVPGVARLWCMLAIRLRHCQLTSAWWG
jgi:hypothetical protein